MHATGLRSNVKGEFSLELAPCTLLVGLNRAGKSRVIDALSIALCGEAHSDGLGKQESRLMALKPEDAKGLFSEVELSGGVKVGWASTGTTAKAKRATWRASGEVPLPAAVMLGDLASSLITADPKRLRPALLSQLDVSVGLDLIRGRTAASLWPDMQRLLGTPTDGAYGTAALMKALAGVSEELRQRRASLRAAKKELEGGVTALTDVEEAELRRLIELASAAVMTEADIEELRRLGARLDEETEATRGEIEGMGPASEVDSVIYQLVDTIRKAQVVLGGYVESQGKTEVQCPMCGTEGIGIGVLRAKAEEFAKLLSSMDSERRNDLRREELEKRVRSLGGQRQELEQKLRDAHAGEDVDRNRLRLLQEQKARAERAAALGERKLQLEAEVSSLKTLQTLCQDIVAASLDTEVSKLEERINLGLPEDMRVGIALRDGTKEVCRLELNGHDVRALSGAERASLVAAFSSAVVQPSHPPVRLLVVDDVWLDPTMIPAVLDGVKTLVATDGVGPTQAIVSLVAYDGPDPDGWRVVRL